MAAASSGIIVKAIRIASCAAAAIALQTTLTSVSFGQAPAAYRSGEGATAGQVRDRRLVERPPSGRPMKRKAKEKSSGRKGAKAPQADARAPDSPTGAANATATAPGGAARGDVDAEQAGKDARVRPMRASDAELVEIARTYCTNNAANAMDARVAWQSRRLRELENEVLKKSEMLASLAQEARLWVEKREKMWGTARDSLAEVYAKMKPEAAAQQLAAMSEDSAASIITRLNPRAASAILNEMGPDRAARLADGALRRPGGGASREKSGS